MLKFDRKLIKKMHKQKTILIDIVDPRTTKEDALKSMDELVSLVGTYNGVVVEKVIQKRATADYETYIGKGKVEEVIELAKELGAELVIINQLLKPKQTYNLKEKFREANLDIEVWDRIDLILKIFSKHAKSTEAKLQIKLAGIRHMGPRIFGMGLELSRQDGAVGVRAGQGESNVEIMKRHLRKQEIKLLKKLEHYQAIRKGHRERRRRNNFKTIAIVGYTNAGKSSLLNALTGKGAYVADELFATLDTRVGKLYICERNEERPCEYVRGTEVLLSDTIGFIQNLPPSLIKAFKSTLAETIDADIIMHVIDSSDPEIEMKIQVVEDVLKQLGADKKPKLYVFNKIDLVDIKKSEDAELDEELEKPTVVEGSPEAAQLLGWTDKNDKKVFSQDFVEQYSRYTPVMISTVLKQNFEELKQKIRDMVI